MFRVLVSVPMLAMSLIASPAPAQQINTSMSDRQIIGIILKECRDLYMRNVGNCACADERTRNSAQCTKVLQNVPVDFKPFCKNKDVTLREVSMFRMQNEGFIDQRCSK